MILLAAILFAQDAPKPSGPNELVIKAAVGLSIAYAAWQWEKKCHSLSPKDSTDFDALMQDDLKRLHDAADARLYDATVGAGRETAEDPKFASCTGDDTKGFGAFGLGQAREAQTTLQQLPPGYHLTITK